LGLFKLLAEREAGRLLAQKQPRDAPIRKLTQIAFFRWIRRKKRITPVGADAGVSILD
jgi:hypothetical protein